MSSLGPVRVQVRHGGAEGEREDEEESEGGEGEEVSLTA